MSTHVIAELGLRVLSASDTVEARADVPLGACFPDSGIVRTSVLATWSDVVTGTVAGHFMQHRIPLTLDLEVSRLGGPQASRSLIVEASAVKVGRTVVVCESRFSDEDSGDLVALSFASFIASPNPDHVFPDGFPVPPPFEGRLTMPLAERVGRTIVSPGTVEVPRREDGLNASGAIQGGLVALAAEEAVLSRVARPTVLRSLNVRYLRPFSVGPARAVATVGATSGVVHLTDAGTGKLAALATAQVDGTGQ